MKKLISLLLTLVMVVSFATVAFAEKGDVVDNKVTITKMYELVGYGISPEESFSFSEPTAVSVEHAASGVTTKNMPMISVGTVKFLEGAAGSADKKTGTVDITIPGVSNDPGTVTLPSGTERFTAYPSVGVYTYSFSETASTTAGVDCYGETMKVVVTVTQSANGLLRVAAVHCEKENGENKSDKFTNTYVSGSLSVTKNVAGNLGDQNKSFGFKVTFTAPEGKTVKSSIGYTLAGTNQTALSFTEGQNTLEVTFSLKHGQAVSFTNIPEGVTYKVEETDTDTNYKTTYSLNNGTATEGKSVSDSISSTSVGGVKTSCDNDSVVFTNTYDGGAVDTGITLDSVPFILILAVCAGAAILLVVRKRRATDF